MEAAFVEKQWSHMIMKHFLCTSAIYFLTLLCLINIHIALCVQGPSSWHILRDFCRNVFLIRWLHLFFKTESAQLLSKNWKFIYWERYEIMWSYKISFVHYHRVSIRYRAWPLWKMPPVYWDPLVSLCYNTFVYTFLQWSHDYVFFLNSEDTVLKTENGSSVFQVKLKASFCKKRCSIRSRKISLVKSQ